MKKPKPSKLAAAYLDELGYLSAIAEGEIPPSTAATLVERAEQVAKEVKDRFEVMRKCGHLKEWTHEFKIARRSAMATGKPSPTWNGFATIKQESMIRAIAGEIAKRKSA